MVFLNRFTHTQLCQLALPSHITLQEPFETISATAAGGQVLTGGPWVTRMSVCGGTLLSQGCRIGEYWKLIYAFTSAHLSTTFYLARPEE